MKNKIRSLPHIQGGTRTDRALELAGEEFFGWEETGDRPDVPNVVVVLTDGDTNEGSKPFSKVLPSLEVNHQWHAIFSIRSFWEINTIPFIKFLSGFTDKSTIMGRLQISVYR